MRVKHAPFSKPEARCSDQNKTFEESQPHPYKPGWCALTDAFICYLITSLSNHTLNWIIFKETFTANQAPVGGLPCWLPDYPGMRPPGHRKHNQSFTSFYLLNDKCTIGQKRGHSHWMAADGENDQRWKKVNPQAFLPNVTILTTWTFKQIRSQFSPPGDNKWCVDMTKHFKDNKNQRQPVSNQAQTIGNWSRR